MPLFQVQYKTNSQTHTINLSSDSWQKGRDFAQDVISGEITEIREFIHEDNRFKKDDGDYTPYISLFIKNDSGAFRSVKVPKVKRNLTNEFIQGLILSHLKIHNLKPHSVIFSSKIK